MKRYSNFIFSIILILIQSCSQKGAEKATETSETTDKKPEVVKKDSNPENPTDATEEARGLSAAQKKSLENWKLALVKTCSVKGVFGTQDQVVRSGAPLDTPGVDLGQYKEYLRGLPQFVFGEPEGFPGEITTTTQARSQSNRAIKSLELQTRWKDRTCTVKVDGQVVVELELARRIPILAFFPNWSKVVLSGAARTVRKTGDWNELVDPALVQTLRAHFSPDVKEASASLGKAFQSKAPSGTPLTSAEELEQVLVPFGHAPGQEALLWSYRGVGGAEAFSNFRQPEWLEKRGLFEKVSLAQSGGFEIEAFAKLPPLADSGGKGSCLRVVFQIQLSQVSSNPAAWGKSESIAVKQFEKLASLPQVYSGCVLERTEALKAFKDLQAFGASSHALDPKRMALPEVAQVFSPCLIFSPSAGVDLNSPGYLGRMLSILFEGGKFAARPETDMEFRNWSQFLLRIEKALQASGRDFRKELDPEGKREVVQTLGSRLHALRNIREQAAGIGLEKWAENLAPLVLLANSSESQLQNHLRSLEAAKAFVARDNHSELWLNDPSPDGKHRSRQELLLMALNEGWDASDFNAVEKLVVLLRFHSACRPKLSTAARIVCAGIGNFSKVSGLLQPKFNGRYSSEGEKWTLLLEGLENKRDPSGIGATLLQEIVSAYFPHGKKPLWGAASDPVFLASRVELFKKLEAFLKESETAKLGEIRLAVLRLLISQEN